MKEDLPVSNMNVEECNLIVRRSSTAEVTAASQHITWQGQRVKNFKRFRKVINRLLVIVLLFFHEF